MRLSRAYLFISVLSLFALPAAHAQNSAACKSVQFSDKVVQRFPGVADACLDIVDKTGQKYAVIKAHLVRTGRNTLYVKFKRPDGSHGATRKITVDPARRVLIEGKPVRVEDLAAGQELTAYVKVTEPVLALAPANDTEPLDLQPLEPETTQVASASTGTMPHTAGPVPTFAAAGITFLLFGGLLAVLRVFRLRRSV